MFKVIAPSGSIKVIRFHADHSSCERETCKRTTKMKLVLVLLAFLALTVSVCSSLSYNEEELVYSSGGRLK